MAYNVKFLLAEKAKFQALVNNGTVDSNAFYYISDTTPREFYLGEIKLSNQADFLNAISQLKGGSDATIKSLEDLLVVLNGSEDVDGSVKKQIKTAIDNLVAGDIQDIKDQLAVAGKVDDVKVNGEFVVTEKIANISIGNHYEAAALPDASGYKKDDVIVIKETENGVDFRTAYYHNGSDWVAMDGNYDAENVYFNSDLIYTNAIGVLAKPASSATLAAKGKNVKQVLSSIMAKEANPTASAPILTVTGSNTGSFEVGTRKTVSYTTSFNAGSYTYGPATGITASDYKISFNGQILTGTSGTFNEVQITDSTSLNISGTFDHIEGATPLTNLGNEYAAAKISAANDKVASIVSGNLSGYRNMFQGTMTTKPETMTSAQMRALTSKKSATGNVSVSVPVGAYRVVVAVPQPRVVTSVLDVNGLNAQIFSSFKSTTVDVEGANGYTAKTYNVYYLDYANANDKANTYTVKVE